MQFIHILLLLLTLTLSFYDFRTRRVPNWVTLPLLLAGMVIHAPGTMETWLGTALLFTFWRFEALGGGDAKLWMALLWLAPPGLARASFFVLFGSILLTAFAQLLLRKVRGQAVTGHKTPGAWRAIPFAVWLMLVSGV
ncbi:MAG: hypothetical protein Fur0022_02460 [Anaerolineales bacterium]